MDEGESRIVLREALAIRLAQRGASNDNGLAAIESGDRQRAHAAEPRCTVRYGERPPPPHLLAVRRLVAAVSPHDPRPNRPGQSPSNGRLPGPRRPDEHDRSRKVSHAAHLVDTNRFSSSWMGPFAILSA